MAPFLGIFVLIAVLGVWAICCVAGLITWIIGWRRKSRDLKLIGAFPIAVTALIVAFLVVKDWLTTPEQHASFYLNLPPEAKVVKIEDGAWAGDGIVYFKLPSNKPVTKWLDEVWQINVPANTNGDFSISRDWQGRYAEAGVAHRYLSYDATTGLYIYDVRGDS
jgi:hypothetical protein